MHYYIISLYDYMTIYIYIYTYLYISISLIIWYGYYTITYIYIYIYIYYIYIYITWCYIMLCSAEVPRRVLETASGWFDVKYLVRSESSGRLPKYNLDMFTCCSITTTLKRMLQAWLGASVPTSFDQSRVHRRDGRSITTLIPIPRRHPPLGGTTCLTLLV